MNTAVQIVGIICLTLITMFGLLCYLAAKYKD